MLLVPPNRIAVDRVLESLELRLESVDSAREPLDARICLGPAPEKAARHPAPQTSVWTFTAFGPLSLASAS
jgi:hypothetical protein